MTESRTTDLWAKFLGDRDLEGREETELLAALDRDPALRDELLADAELDGLLRARERDPEVFRQAFFDRLAAERDSTRFIRKVTLRHRRRAASSAPPVLPIIALAAAALFAIALVATRGSEKPRPPAPAERIVAVRPPPPPPPSLPTPILPTPVPESPLPRPSVEEVAPKPQPPATTPEAEKPRPAATPRTTAHAPPPLAAIMAMVERVEGTVLRLRATTETPLDARQGVCAGDGLRTGPRSEATVKFPDGTRLEVSPDSLIRTLADGGGKRLTLERGTVSAVVARQPVGQPMIFSTPFGTATVLGTSLRIQADPTSTRLEVKEGKVRLEWEGRSVEVTSGQSAVAAPRRELLARPLPPPTIQVNFGPEGLRLPAGVWNDSGEPFDAARGYGWVEIRGSEPADYDAVFVSQTLPAQMIAGRLYTVAVSVKNTGREPWTEAAEIRLGSQDPADNETWGPFRVRLNANEVVGRNQLKTFVFKVKAPSAPGTYPFQWQMLQDRIKRFGALTPRVAVTVGAGGNDTPVTTHGEFAAMGRVAGLNPRASFVAAGSATQTETWVLPVANGRYLVTLTAGSSLEPRGPHHVAIEGIQVLDAVSTKPGEVLQRKDVPLEVADGELTVVVGGHRRERDGATVLNSLLLRKAPDELRK